MKRITIYTLIMLSLMLLLFPMTSKVYSVMEWPLYIEVSSTNVKVGEPIHVYAYHCGGHRLRFRVFEPDGDELEGEYITICNHYGYAHYFFTVNEKGYCLLVVECLDCGEVATCEIKVRTSDTIYFKVLGPTYVAPEEEANVTVICYNDDVDLEPLTGCHIELWRVDFLPERIKYEEKLVANYTVDEDGTFTYNFTMPWNDVIFYAHCIEYDVWTGHYIASVNE